MNKNNIKRFSNILIICMVFIFSFSIIGIKEYEMIQLNNGNTLQTSANSLSNKKIEWGIKRANNNEQPDLGSENKKIIEEYNGICMGNTDKPYIYLTFDCGYEAGYTEKILEVLKENNVKATFFITGHYLNSASEIVERMIEEGHIIGNHTPIFLMSRDNIKMKC